LKLKAEKERKRREEREREEKVGEWFETLHLTGGK
jgi:hypothetical protein